MATLRDLGQSVQFQQIISCSQHYDGTRVYSDNETVYGSLKKNNCTTVTVKQLARAKAAKFDIAHVLAAKLNASCDCFPH